MPFLGVETALRRVGGRRVGIPRPWLFARTSGISDGAPNARPAPRRIRHPTGPMEGKPARGPTKAYRRFFVETVPKRYRFGTGAARNWLDLV